MQGEESARQPFLAHVQELRRRAMYSAIAFAIGGVVGYIWRSVFIDLLQKPLGQPLFYNSPSGGFEFIMRICGLIGLVLAVPVALYNLIKFIEPALKIKFRKRQLVILISCSLTLLALGLAFAYKIVLPLSLHFFSDFSSIQIKPLISAKDYLSFMTTCLGTFAIMFQLPLLLLFIDRVTPLPPARLRRYRKWVIVGSLAVAVILPFTYDPVTQFVIALPIIGLYEFSIILLWVVHRKGLKKSRETIQESMEEAPLVPLPVASSSPVLSRQMIDLRQAANRPKEPAEVLHVLDLRQSQSPLP